MPSSIIIADANTPPEDINACMRLLEEHFRAHVRHHPIHKTLDPTPEQIADATVILFPNVASYLGMAGKGLHRKNIAIAGTKVNTIEFVAGAGPQRQVLEVLDGLIAACLLSEVKAETPAETESTEPAAISKVLHEPAQELTVKPVALESEPTPDIVAEQEAAETLNEATGAPVPEEQAPETEPEPEAEQSASEASADSAASIVRKRARRGNANAAE